MKKILSLSLILLSSLFLSACGVKDNNSSTTIPSEPQEESEESASSSFSLRDLIAKNIPQKCTWSSNADGVESNGTIVISGKKFKQDTNVKQDGFDYIGHTVSDGTYLYTWQDNTNKDSPNIAIKMKLDTMDEDLEGEASPDSDSSESQDSLNLDKEYQYNCTPTMVSESDFQPPTDIEFVDYSQFLEDVQSNIPSIDVSNLE